MSILLDRRALFATAGFGLGGLLLPGGALVAQTLLARTGFTHNVASGEPGPDSVLLWTRYVPASGDAARVRVEVSETNDFTRIASGGQMITGPWRDHTVKITVDDLKPGSWYYYRFIGPDGSVSPIGRTKTLPVGRVKAFNLAIFSCSNLGFGEFNAYGHAAQRTDIDAVLHLGDYFYEYGRGGYDIGAPFAPRIEPAIEIVSIADYRLRYASYRADPQLQALHAAFPMIVSTDDHETANDAWEGGAQNHQREEGDWSVRKNAAMQAWREWLPVGETPWKAYEIGDLATYYRTNTRDIARTKQWNYNLIQKGDDPAKALATFRDGPWQDDAATMLGTEQESWLSHGFARNKAKGWAIVGLGATMGYNYTPPGAINWFAADADARAKTYIAQGIAAGKLGLPYNLDNWGGYPKAKARFLAAAQRTNANLVVVSGDSHNGWAFDLPQGGKPAGVEFSGHSVTSPGIENNAKRADHNEIARGMLMANPQELRFVDSSNRGYMKLSVTPQAVTNEFIFMETVLQKSLATKPGKVMRVRAGRNLLDKS